MHRREDNIKIYRKKYSLNWIHLAHERMQW